VKSIFPLYEYLKLAAHQLALFVQINT